MPGIQAMGLGKAGKIALKTAPEKINVSCRHAKRIRERVEDDPLPYI
jgi:hypothetical protein